jgi:arylsulfatase A-like enzyme
VHKEYVASAEWERYYTERGHSRETANYYGAISSMDEQVGRVRALLHSLDAEYMLWFMSDNGPAKNTPANYTAFRGTKGTLLEGGIRVPAVLESSGFESVALQRAVSTSDVLPTVLDFFNLPVPSKLDGVSVLRQRSSGLGFAYDLEKRFNGGTWQLAWIQNDYKLLERYESQCSGTKCQDELFEAQLFNVQLDRHERTNLIAQERATALEMHRALKLWFSDVERDFVAQNCIVGDSATALHWLVLLLWLFL